MHSRNNKSTKSLSSFGRQKKEQVINHCVRSSNHSDIYDDKSSFGRPKKEQVIDHHVRPSNQDDVYVCDDDQYDNCLGNNVFGIDL
jgi:hypothetical protein